MCVSESSRVRTWVRVCFFLILFFPLSLTSAFELPPLPSDLKLREKFWKKKSELDGSVWRWIAAILVLVNEYCHSILNVLPLQFRGFLVFVIVVVAVSGVAFCRLSMLHAFCFLELNYSYLKTDEVGVTLFIIADLYDRCLLGGFSKFYHSRCQGLIR